MSQKVTFPEKFWWGAAMSGPQMEGTFDKPHENVMDYWYRTQKEVFSIRLDQHRQQIFIIIIKKILP